VLDEAVDERPVVSQFWMHERTSDGIDCFFVYPEVLVHDGLPDITRNE
jgi:hypothetical protein